MTNQELSDISSKASLDELLLSFEAGTRPKGGVKKYKKGIPSIGGEHLTWTGDFAFENVRYIPKDFYERMNRGKIAIGDILVVKDGATTGKTSIVRTNFPYTEAAVNEHVFLLRVDQKRVNPFYLYNYLRSPQGQTQIAKRIKGTAQGGINRRFIENFPIPLPPLSVQKDIVDKLTFTNARTSITKQELSHIPDLTRRLRMVILSKAFRGKMTKRIRNDEPAHFLLEKARIERKNQWILDAQKRGRVPAKQTCKKPKPAEIIDLPKIPDSWAYANIDPICFQVTDGEHVTPPRTESGVFLLSARNVLNGKLSLDDVDYISQDEHDRICKRVKPEEGDVLLSCSGSVGRSCVVPSNLEFSMVRSVAILKPIRGVVLGEYLSLALRSDILQLQIQDKKTQTAQANIFQGKIRSLIIPLAPLKEQEIIIRIVHRWFYLLEEVNNSNRSSLEILNKLERSILHQAFSGNLGYEQEEKMLQSEQPLLRDFR